MDGRAGGIHAGQAVGLAPRGGVEQLAGQVDRFAVEHAARGAFAVPEDLRLFTGTDAVGDHGQQVDGQLGLVTRCGLGSCGEVDGQDHGQRHRH
jgi:hypothetical protein